MNWVPVAACLSLRRDLTRTTIFETDIPFPALARANKPPMAPAFLTEFNHQAQDVVLPPMRRPRYYDAVCACVFLETIDHPPVDARMHRAHIV